LNGEFEGFDEDHLFALQDGTYWLQDEYKYWYHYAYCPTVQLLNSGGRTFIRVQGASETVAVRQISSVIRSKIDGEFHGWDGNSRYRLQNGQVWEQAKYKYKYKYKYSPEVLIYDTAHGKTMFVAGTKAVVRRV
jgi:hypothetical protein